MGFKGHCRRQSLERPGATCGAAWEEAPEPQGPPPSPWGVWLPADGLGEGEGKWEGPRGVKAEGYKLGAASNWEEEEGEQRTKSNSARQSLHQNIRPTHIILDHAPTYETKNQHIQQSSNIRDNSQSYTLDR